MTAALRSVGLSVLLDLTLTRVVFIFFQFIIEKHLKC